MKRPRSMAIATLLGLCAATSALAQAPLDPRIKRTYEVLGGGMSSPAALLYEPQVSGTKSHIAVIAMHSDLNYVSFSACTQLSRRGYRVLCVNRSGSPGGSLNQTILDLRQAVVFLRKLPGVDRVVLLGHSGGATLMSAYQMIAESGVSGCQGTEKISKCPDELAGLPAADAVMLIDSNFGNAEMMLLSLDPAVGSEEGGTDLNPELDSFNPQNGFVRNGTSSYGTDFRKKFERAVAGRERALTQRALARLAAIQAGGGKYIDDEPLVVPGGAQGASNNRLLPQDTRLLSHTVKPWPLLHADGSSTTQIVHSVRVPDSNTQSPTPSLAQGAVQTTVRTFLTNWAIRVTDDFEVDEDGVHGVEWNSSYSSTPGNVQGMSVPLLVMGMTGHYEYLAAETIYEQARSPDKTIAFVEGGTHMYTTCKACERYPGQYGDTEKTTYDYIDLWLSQRGRFESRDPAGAAAK